MLELCKRGSILSSVLRQAPTTVASKCTSRKSTGRPSNSELSFGMHLTSFNDHVPLDYMYITELGHQPILHIFDVRTGFSVTSLMKTREMNKASPAFDKEWCDVHGPLVVVSSDPEFLNYDFKSFSKYAGVKWQPRPARRHKKLRVAESKNTVVRLIAQRTT